MTLRKIVKIDEEKCNGCGLCIPNCAEGALKIVDGKAKLVSEVFCDGLGACLGHCPQDAIHIEEREAENFDEVKVEENLNKNSAKEEVKTMDNHVHHGGCPGSMMRQFKKPESKAKEIKNVESQLRQWPVQLTLVPPSAPYFKNADLLITADCVPVAYGNYHNDYLKGKAVVMGCPKLDNVDSYIDKLADIIEQNDLESITVLKMEVPCCSGIAQAAKLARDKAGVDIPIKVVTISLEGEVSGKQYI